MSAPPEPVPATARLVGQYGGVEAILDVYENAGRLHAHGHGFIDARLEPEGDDFIEITTGRRAAFLSGGKAVVIGTDTLFRRDFGAEAIADSQRSLRAGRPSHSDDGAHPPALGTAPLVSLACAIPSIGLDIRYAGSDNFMGFPVYERACAFARPAVVAALARAQEALLCDGYGLVVHDAYRPWSVTKRFWDAVPLDYRAFVADPATGSKHNRGCAIDLTLRRAVSGALVEMPSRYDEPTARSRFDYSGGTARQRWHRDLLRFAMEAHGFVVQPDEWWHFDFRDWRDYPIEDTPLAALAD